MAVITRYSPPAIFSKFTHRGWLLLCPIYTNASTGDVSERNGIPEVWFWVNVGLLSAASLLRGLLGLEPWDGWPLLHTGRIGHGVIR